MFFKHRFFFGSCRLLHSLNLGFISKCCGSGQPLICALCPKTVCPNSEALVVMVFHPNSAYITCITVILLALKPLLSIGNNGANRCFMLQ